MEELLKKLILLKKNPSLAELVPQGELIKMMDTLFTAYKDFQKAIDANKLKGDKGDKGDRGENGRNGVDGKNGKDGRDGIDGVDGVDGKDGEMGIIDEATIAYLEDKIATLQTEMEKNVKELEGVRRGGGVTNARITQAFKYILKTESPSGLINGVNTVYTVNDPIFTVFSFSLNGEVIAQLPNYTIAGRTITFSTPLPAVYSGKDFEIKYI